IELVLRLVPREERRKSIFDWTYKKNRSSEALSLASNSEYGMTQGSGPSDQPEFTLKDKAYEAEWSQIYAKNTLTQLVGLTIAFRSIDTHAFKNDLLILNVESLGN
ncbi:hypothetical protein, partial [Chromohalobacter nigrandesensis]|uniref:hypothetical protein n=1 Tax=Chromohalobacter nigrandesensis TaxID=119863 RepID=UPI001FF22446